MLGQLAAISDTWASEELSVDCAPLSGEQAAELEARARAALLTTNLAVTAHLACTSVSVEATVVGQAGSVVLSAPSTLPALMDDALSVLDSALLALRERVTEPAPEPAPEPQPHPAPPRTPASVAPAVGPPAPTPTSPSPPLPGKLTRSPRWVELGAALAGEAWEERVAPGGAAAFGLTRGFVTYGARLGVFSAPGIGELQAFEAHLVAVLALDVPSLWGLRGSLGVGPSIFLVSPDSPLTALSGSSRSAVRLEARVGRPFAWGAWHVAPFVGLRVFSAERGARVLREPRVTLGGVLPQCGLELSWRR